MNRSGSRTLPALLVISLVEGFAIIVLLSELPHCLLIFEPCERGVHLDHLAQVPGVALQSLG